jgi:hypothetical protein
VRIVWDLTVDFAKTCPGMAGGLAVVLFLLPLIIEIFSFVNRLLAR